MNDKDASALHEALARKHARLMEEANALARDMAEIARLKAEMERLAAKHRDAQPPAEEIHDPQTHGPIFRYVIEKYLTHKDSPYHKLKFSSRGNYDWMLGVLNRGHGDKRLADLKERDIRRFYEEWAADGKMTTARGLIGMVRQLFNFGATILEDTECERLSAAIHRMRFPMVKPRNQQLTADQANAVRAKAHEMGLPSIALAQAFQFECRELHQKDIIGEWAPHDEQGDSKYVDGKDKWICGLRWLEIDRDFVLRHPASNNGKMLHLRLSGMVLEEIAKFTAKFGEQLANDAIIKSEVTGRPYRAHHFRETWRKVAHAAGVPKDVNFADSRTRSTNANRSNGAAPPDEARDAEWRSEARH
jgi:hypothetical protein